MSLTEPERDVENENTNFECRECQEEFELDGDVGYTYISEDDRYLCDDCKEILEEELLRYPTIESFLKEVDDMTIADIAEKVNEHDLEDLYPDDDSLEKLREEFKQYMSKDNGSEFIEEKDDYIVCGHTDESFFDFCWYPFLDNIVNANSNGEDN